MAEINANKTRIGDIFSKDFLLKIPDFQRPLSWKKDNFAELFEDIYTAFTEKQEEYFLGSIILQKEGEINSYLIIDGQQRLTSIAILLAMIRDRTENQELKKSIQKSLFEEGDKFKKLPSAPRIKMWEDLSSFESYIYEPSKTNMYVKEIDEGKIKYADKQDPRYSLYEAIKVFNEEYDEKFKGNGSSDGNFVEYLFTKVYLVNIWTEELPYAIKLFNVLNTRGLPLTNADILKAVNLAEIEVDKRSKYAKIWREVEENIGREEVENVIEFIRTMKLKRKYQASIYEEYNKYLFGNGLLVKGEDFINYLKNVADMYDKYVLDPKDIEIENKYRNLINLMVNYIPYDDWVPPLLSFYEKHQNDWHNKKSVNDLLPEFLYTLERKTVIEWVAGFTPTKRLLSLIDVINLVDKGITPEAFINKLKDNSIDKNLKESFKEKINGTDFYNENFAKYLLLRIDLERVDQEVFKGYREPITIEHILPQNPSENSEWVKNFKEEQRQEWTNRIGNLVLLGRRKNVYARNYDFDKKKSAYFLKGGDTPFKITEEIKKYDDWNISILKERQDKLIYMLLKMYFGD